MSMIIDVARQTLSFGDKIYPVSTSKNGLGEKNGSFCTPRGRHIVRAKIGAGQPMYAVFRGRRPTGETWRPRRGEAGPGTPGCADGPEQVGASCVVLVAGTRAAGSGLQEQHGNARVVAEDPSHDTSRRSGPDDDVVDVFLGRRRG